MMSDWPVTRTVKHAAGFCLRSVHDYVNLIKCKCFDFVAIEKKQTRMTFAEII